MKEMTGAKALGREKVEVLISSQGTRGNSLKSHSERQGSSQQAPSLMGRRRRRQLLRRNFSPDTD